MIRGSVRRRALARGLGIALALAPATALAEPDDPGPFEVEVDEYDFGDEVVVINDFPFEVEMRAAVYSPVDLAQGPFPLVVLLHGRHSTCYNPDTPMGVPGDGSFNGAFFEWPCGFEREPIPSHEGYAYAAESLASHGYIVVSISANGINAGDNGQEDGGANARARLIVEHLNQWAVFNGSDAEPFDGKFMGALDFDRIGIMGHSRGGEGVANAIAIDQEAGSPIGFDAALLLAPVDFLRPIITDATVSVVLPYCDGDVADLQGAHYFDDARYAEPGDQSSKYIFTMDGANHNYFNTIWSPSTFISGAGDDFESLTGFLEETDPHCNEGANSGRLSEGAQQAGFVAYMNAFFRRHLGDETEFDPLLRGDVYADSFQAPVFTSYIGPDDPSARLDVNHLDTDEDLEVNTLGEAVSVEGLDPYDLCGLLLGRKDFDSCMDEPEDLFGPVDPREPHTPGLGQLRMTFEPGARWENELPAGTDVSALTVLQFRAVPDYEGPEGVDDGVELTATLTDASGASATVSVNEYSIAFDLPPGTLVPLFPKKLLHGVRIPLEAFEGVDLTDLASVVLELDGSGALVLSDLAFTDPVPEEPGGTGTGTGGNGGSSDGGLDDTAGEGDSTGAAPGTTGDVLEDGDGADSETGDSGASGNDGDEGCGCRQSGPAYGHSGWLAVMALFGLRRRRPSA